MRCLSCGPSAGARAVLAANDLTHVAFEEAPVEEVFGTDAPALVVVLDPDLFDEGLLGRRLLPYVRHCRRHLAVPECVVIPARARVYCAPLAARLPDSHGIPLGALDAYRWGPWYEELDLDGSMQALQGTYTLLAPPRPCFALDFGADDVEEALRAREVGLEFAASAGGVLNGVAFWYELEMVDELRHATGPGSGGKQAVQWVDPVTVKKGSHIKITAQLMETRLTFALWVKWSVVLDDCVLSGRSRSRAEGAVGRKGLWQRSDLHLEFHMRAYRDQRTFLLYSGVERGSGSGGVCVRYVWSVVRE